MHKSYNICIVRLEEILKKSLLTCQSEKNMHATIGTIFIRQTLTFRNERNMSLSKTV